MNDLFPSDFLAAIEQLALAVSSAAPAVSAGSHLSRTAGSSMDFRDYRQYVAGDDLRRVDWNVFRRSGHLFLRRFDHPTTAPVYVLLDTSESMFVEEPTRYATGARVAAAIASAALREHDGVSLIPFGQNAPPPLNRLTHRRRLPEVLDRLSSFTSGGAGSFAAGVDALTRHGRRTGIAVVISDFFDEEGAENLVSALSEIRHRIVLVQITQPWDAEPSLDDELELVDCENGRTSNVFPSNDTLTRYREAYRGYQSQLEAFAARRASVYVKLDASADTTPQLGKLFPSGMLHVPEVRR